MIKLPILSRNEIFEQFEHCIFFINWKIYDMHSGWLLDHLTQLKYEYDIQNPFNNHNVVQLTKDNETYQRQLGTDFGLVKIFNDYSAVKTYYDIQKMTGNLDIINTIYQLMYSGIPFTCEGGKSRGTIIFVKDDFMYILMDKIWIIKTYGITPYNYNAIDFNQKLNLEGFYV
jgi:hypothetical protein